MRETRVDGVMAARGALANPAMFLVLTSRQYNAWLTICRWSEYGGHFGIHQHHLLYMLSSLIHIG